MLSRVANSIYWMTRYLERADNIARFMDVNASLILDIGWERKNAQWKPLIQATGDEEIFDHYYKEYNEKNVIYFLTFDKRNINSIINCIKNSRENARIIREIISSEMWKMINSLFHLVESHSRKRKIDDLQEFFTEIHNYNYLFVGLIENTMMHNDEWHFARIGRLLERAEKTTRLLDVKYFFLKPNSDYPISVVEWGALLKSVNGYEMYCKQFHRINHQNISEFLILNKSFPRAISHCIHSLTISLFYLIDTLNINIPIRKEINKLNRLLDVLNINFIIENNLHNFLDLLLTKFNIIDTAIYNSFFDIKPKNNIQNSLNTETQ